MIWFICRLECGRCILRGEEERILILLEKLYMYKIKDLSLFN